MLPDIVIHFGINYMYHILWFKIDAIHSKDMPSKNLITVEINDEPLSNVV